MRFEEAARFRHHLEALTTLAHRATRLSQVVTENNLVIVTGAGGRSRSARRVVGTAGDDAAAGEVTRPRAR